MVALSGLSPVVYAQDGEKTVIQSPSAMAAGQRIGPTVKEIEIEYAGPRSVAREVILSNMRTTVGQPYSPSAVEEDIRNLYATGFFTNLRIYDEPMADGVKVVVVVQPKASIKEIVVAGAKELSEKAVRKKITSKVGDTLNEQKISADAQAIRDFYQDKGFREAQVEYKIDINEQIGRAVVVYTIQENRRGWVRDIEFVGNKAVTSKELRKAIKTKTKDWLSWINKSGRYKDEQFQEDLKKIRDFYYDRGYIDMTIRDVAYEPFDEDSLRIKITVFEGIQYEVGKVTIENNTLFSNEQLRARMGMLEGKVFSPRGLDGDIKAIKDAYGERGYVEANVNARRMPNIESARMDLVYQVQENEQFYVEKIVIQGNNRTKDKVLRRELALAPGDVYDTVSAEASKARLENLGYFSKVDVSDQDTSVPGRKNMVVTVEEKRTGSITFGAGFSTVDSVLGFVELQQGNFDIANFPTFTGAGQKFRLRIQYGLRRQDVLLSVTEPWFLNQRLSLGFDLFYNNSSYDSSVFDQRRFGAAVRLARALNQFWTVGLRYQVESIEIYDVDGNPIYNLLRNEEAGTRTKSSVRAALTYDTRDNVFLTRKGEKLEFSAEGAGGPLMGDTDIWKLELSAQKFFSLPYDMILSLNAATGVTDSFGDSPRVPLYDRFFIGGSRSIRGFDHRSVGPRYLDVPGGLSEEPYGGRTMAYGNVELTYPIIDRVRGAVFVDAGFNNLEPFDYDVSDYELGVGLGLRLNLPIGPLRLDIGFPLVYDYFNNDTWKFHFDVGYQF
jgi:outer membrane protein insertion porin family